MEDLAYTSELNKSVKEIMQRKTKTDQKVLTGFEDRAFAYLDEKKTQPYKKLDIVFHFYSF